MYEQVMKSIFFLEFSDMITFDKCVVAAGFLMKVNEHRYFSCGTVAVYKTKDGQQQEKGEI